MQMGSDKELDEGLIKKIKTSIRLARSARHVPGKVSCGLAKGRIS